MTLNHATGTKDEEMGEQQPRRSSTDNSGRICSVGVAAPSKKDSREPQLIKDKLQRRSGMPENPATGSTSPYEMPGEPDIKEHAVNSTSTEEALMSATYNEVKRNIIGQEERNKPRTEGSSKEDECHHRLRPEGADY